MIFAKLSYNRQAKETHSATALFISHQQSALLNVAHALSPSSQDQPNTHTLPESVPLTPSSPRSASTHRAHSLNKRLAHFAKEKRFTGCAGPNTDAHVRSFTNGLQSSTYGTSPPRLLFNRNGHVDTPGSKFSSHILCRAPLVHLLAVPMFAIGPNTGTPLHDRYVNHTNRLKQPRAPSV